MSGSMNKDEYIILDEIEVKECWKEYCRDLYWNISDILKRRIEMNAMKILIKMLCKW